MKNRIRFFFEFIEQKEKKREKCGWEHSQSEQRWERKSWDTCETLKRGKGKKSGLLWLTCGRNEMAFQPPAPRCRSDFSSSLRLFHPPPQIFDESLPENYTFFTSKHSDNFKKWNLSKFLCITFNVLKWDNKILRLCAQKLATNSKSFTLNFDHTGTLGEGEKWNLNKAWERPAGKTNQKFGPNLPVFHWLSSQPLLRLNDLKITIMNT